MSVIVPLTAVPSQSVTIQLAGQSCRIDVFQKTFGVFVDLYIGDAPVVLGVLALNLTFIVREPSLGFIGDFSFYDTAGTADPSYEGLGSRYVLLWYDATELPADVY